MKRKCNWFVDASQWIYTRSVEEWKNWLFDEMVTANGKFLSEDLAKVKGVFFLREREVAPGLNRLGFGGHRCASPEDSPKGRIPWFGSKGLDCCPGFQTLPASLQNWARPSAGAAAALLAGCFPGLGWRARDSGLHGPWQTRSLTQSLLSGDLLGSVPEHCRLRQKMPVPQTCLSGDWTTGVAVTPTPCLIRAPGGLYAVWEEDLAWAVWPCLWPLQLFSWAPVCFSVTRTRWTLALQDCKEKMRTCI